MISAESHVESALAAQRPVYRTESIDTLTRLLFAPFEDVEAAYQDLISIRELGLRGAGAALDFVGALASARRGGLDDALYRQALTARIAALNSSGTLEDLIAVARAVIPRSTPSVVRAIRGARLATLEIYLAPSVAPPLDAVELPPPGIGLIPDGVDGAYTAGDDSLLLLVGDWPEVGRFQIAGHPETYSYSTPSYVPGAPNSLISIVPPLARALNGTELLVGPLGLTAPALRYLRDAIAPAASAGDDLQVAGGTTGIESALALASAIHVAAGGAAAGATVLSTSGAVTRQLPSTGYLRPPGGVVTRYRVTSPGVLALDVPLPGALATGALVELVTADGAAWRPGLGLGVGALYGVAG